MSSDPPRGVQFASTGAGVHCDGLADDETIADKLADRLAGVGVGDFVDFVGVEPDLALSAADHGGSKTLLSAEVDPVDEKGMSAGGSCGVDMFLVRLASRRRLYWTPSIFL